MSDIVKEIAQRPGFISFSPTSDEQINKAEADLGITFAADYRAYVAAFGAASFEGHELTGVCASPRLNVVQVTAEEREQNPNVAEDWYVLEQLHIDGVVVWQSSSGEVYQTVPGAQPVKVAKSISEYIG